MKKNNVMFEVSMKLFTLLMIFFICCPVSAYPQKSSQEILDSFEKTLELSAFKDTSAVNKSGHLTKHYSKYDSVRFEKEMQIYDFSAHHMKRSFTWQFYSSIFIFIMVMLIVCVGLLLSYKQFQLTEFQIKSNPQKVDEQKTESETNTTSIEISQTGLKINTAVIGLAILFLSLLFFFLYLKYVYIIEVLNV